jgi:transposase
MDRTAVRAFVGIDWATEEHAVCVVDAHGAVLGERRFVHSGDGLNALCQWLVDITGATPGEIGVAIEVPHGAVVETLLERGFLVHSINPKQLDRFRDRFTVAGAKDDRRDAYVLGDALRTDGHRFRRLEAEDPLVIELREWSRLADEVQQERVRLGNRVRDQLLRYFPQMLRLFPHVEKPAFAPIWRRIPTPHAAHQIRVTTLAQLLRRARVRRVSAADMLVTLRETPVQIGPGTITAATAHIGCALERLGVVNRQLADARRQLRRLCDALAVQQRATLQAEFDDVTILRSIPGLGPVVLGTLIAEAAQPVHARDYDALRALSGVAPVTKNSGKRSGKRSFVVMRTACNPRLREAIHHWARVAMQRDPKSHAAYAALRVRGHSHGRALRTIGDRLLAVACAMLKTRAVFDPSRRAAA